MGKVWLELKYGEGKAGITIYRLADNQLLRAFKRKALAQAEQKATVNEVIDPVVGLLDRFDANRLKAVLELLIPSDEGFS
ncbi:hypothetical protein LM597_00100 [Candidatus Acetothermia bacterium]|nr:hypothetical protein [Candidatus Acetothermia bacterium]